MDLDSFLKQNSAQIRKNIFYKNKNEILELKEKGATLKLILEWLIMNNEEIKNKYINKKNNGIVHLSKTLKKWLKNDTKIIQKKELKNDLKNDDKTIPKEIVKETKNDSVGSSKRVDVAEIMNSNIGTELFNKYNDFN